jgi:hypothetical protein
MDRREFLIASAAGAAGFALPRPAWPQAAPAWKSVKPSTLERISIMTLNFQSLLKLPDYPDTPDRTLDPFTIAEMLADRYGVHKVEFQHYHIPSTETSYLIELRGHIEKSRSRMTQINVEFGQLNISAPTLRDRLMAIDLTKMWVDHAVVLGAQRVMINQGQPTPDNKAKGIAALKTMVDYGKSKGIIVSVETRGGLGRGQTTNPTPITGPTAWPLLAEIIKGAGAYSNVDVGGAGAGNQEELHQCLRMFFPMTAGSLHTRVSPQWDLATAIRFLEHDLGYTGLYNIEAANGHEGTQQIFDVVVSTL